MLNKLKDDVVVEVFKTSVKSVVTAKLVMRKLEEVLPNARINFDLEDCDNILRIEGPWSELNVEAILGCVNEWNIEIEVLS